MEQAREAVAEAVFTLRSICCVCGRELGSQTSAVDGISHGYCARHLAEALADLDLDCWQWDEAARIERETEAAWREHDAARVA